MARAVKPAPPLTLPFTPRWFGRRLLRPPVKLPSLPRLPAPDAPDVFVEMTLVEHLEELRARLIKAAVAVGVAFIPALALANPLLRVMAAQAGVLGGWDLRSPIEVLTVYMKVALDIAIALALPVVLYQFFAFLVPGLTNKEKRILFTSLPFVAALFVAGAAYAVLEAVPRALAFMKVFGRASGFGWQIDGDETVDFYTTMMVGVGLAFELPVVMYLLARLNVVSPKQMRAYRKYAILLITVAAAVITPTTDPVNLSLVAVPMYALYEIGILVSSLFARPKSPPDAGPVRGVA